MQTFWEPENEQQAADYEAWEAQQEAEYEQAAAQAEYELGQETFLDKDK